MNLLEKSKTFLEMTFYHLIILKVFIYDVSIEFTLNVNLQNVLILKHYININPCSFSYKYNLLIDPCSYVYEYIKIVKIGRDRNMLVYGGGGCSDNESQHTSTARIHCIIIHRT